MQEELPELFLPLKLFSLICEEEHGGGMAASATDQTLPFNMERQTQDHWCWAATAKSVSHFYDLHSHWTQCLVAEKAFLTNFCCLNPAPCNQDYYLNEALTFTGNFNQMINGPLGFNAIKTELEAGRVIGARTAWRGGGAHFMVIYGCRHANGTNYLSIDDPMYGKSEITEIAFQTNYQGTGTWTHTYLTNA